MVNDDQDDMADDWAAAMAEQADADEALANPISFEELQSENNKTNLNPELEVILD
ncbi:MAG: flagellar motor switch protein FliN, partial [Chitinophagaceae bacterium]